MQKPIVERLREWSRITNRPELEAAEEFSQAYIDEYTCDMPALFRAIADEIERYYIPRPRFEDGEPARFGNELENGKHIATITYTVSGRCLINDTVQGSGQSKADYCLDYKQETLKRPQPKVYDADGVEIKVGDTVWATFAGRVERCIVEGFTDGGCVEVLFEPDYAPSRLSPKCLTHKEPDSREKWIHDIEMYAGEYCGSVNLDDLEEFFDRAASIALIERGA